MLTSSSLPAWERDLYSKLRQVLNRPGLMRGNLVLSRRTCGKPSCRCRKGPRKGHPSLYLGISLEGKHHMLYVPPEWHDRVREWVDRYAHVRAVLERLSLACLKRLKSREE